MVKFHAGKGDEAESSAILNTYFNVADEFKGLGQFDDALRMSSRGTEVAKLFHSQSQEGNFLIVSALVYQARGNVDQAFSDIQQSVKLLYGARTGSRKGDGPLISSMRRFTRAGFSGKTTPPVWAGPQRV